ncbi:MAG: carboxylating nicotinate-nucleotide diphosphorylase [Verrucomicrobia bacterium]|nr:carboxylating nicotinate-nucleotide diphosphorylase [Verrucomicrobiota bacterium]MBI3869878.1 carboxylating nicotinate-nucleotide diphosphorylase [Verrucomicrobiota bacterium]
MALSGDELRQWVRIALSEDVGVGDVTTQALVPPQAMTTAVMVAREPLTVAGLELAELTFHECARAVQVVRHSTDGEAVEKGRLLLKITGPAAPILTAERVALNFVQRLSGVATLTARYVDAARGTSAQILDTRKTTPGLRRLEKYAVACGGGKNHRMGLYDQILIKDNHVATLASESDAPIALAVRRAREKFPHMRIEVEADTLAQVEEAAAAGANIILLDNMSLADMATAVRSVRGRSRTEASGGVNLDTVRAIAETGVDYISVGALTHSARSVDIALDFVETPQTPNADV